MDHSNAPRRGRVRACATALTLIWIASTLGFSQSSTNVQPPAPEGLRDATPNVYALRGARVVVEAGRVLDSATIVVRDGIIAAINTDGSAPPDARLIDATGRTVYAGFIDAYGQYDVSSSGSNGASSPYWNNNIRPGRDVAAKYKADSALDASLRGQGITARLVAPSRGIIKGRSAVVNTSDSRDGRALVAADVGLHARLTLDRRGGRDSYPNSPMGAVALARQAIHDARWYEAARKVAAADRSLAMPDPNHSLESLASFLATGKRFFIETNGQRALLRADRFAREFSLPLIILGSGYEYRRLDAVKATGRAIILPLNFPSPPSVGTADEARSASLRSLMHWELAPENPARLVKAGVTIAFTTRGLDNVGGFLKAIRQAVERGLSPDDALRALTTDAARLLGVDEQIGSVSAGKLAHFVVTDGDIFDAKTKISEVWVRGRRYNLDVKPRQDLAGRWKLSFPRQRRDGIEIDLKSQPGLQGNLVLPKPAGEETKDDAKKGATKPEANDAAKKDDAKKDDAKEDAAKEDDAKEAETKEAKPAPPKRRASLKNLRFADSQLQFRFATADPEQTKDADVSAVVFGEPKVTHWSGVVTWPDGTRGAVLAERVPPEEPIAAEAKKDDAATEVAKTQDEDAKAKDDETKGETSKDKTAKPETAKTEQKTPETPIPCPVNFPLGPYGRLAPPAAAKLTVLQGATVWTCGPDGTIENASVLIEDGKVVAVGKSIDVPKGAEVIDVRGRHVTPGIIDCHSHMATDGGVNESGQNITAEVRIGDFINEDDSTIYRHLAGGVTSANILHGSANPIGGQNQVIKLRWGELGEDLKFRAAPAGIKFALGENVKQANWGDNYRTRYPQSRMGVEQLFQDAFRAGRAYAARWKEWEETRRGLPPRRDLELDAIREILAKERWIHCHSYRQDEILAFLRVLESFDVQIGSLQHILEGYKIADVLAKHGATASAFSDWWAYKFEVIDAIPYAGALMHEQGVVVSFNSDDRELGRHLNHEAAKAVRYGGVSEIEALKFVTLNPAKQLRIAHRVGSLEAGKDADFVVWSGHPLSTLSRCEQTWIDGRKYFDLESDKQSRTFIKEWRARLVDRVTKSGDRPKGSGPPREPGEEWSGEDEFCRHSHDDEHRHEENDAAEGGRR